MSEEKELINGSLERRVQRNDPSNEVQDQLSNNVENRPSSDVQVDPSKDRQDAPSNDLEKHLTEALMKGDMELSDPEQAAKHALSPRYEIRIQTEMDPVVEETRLYREIAQEVDHRYDDYLKRGNRQPKQK